MTQLSRKRRQHRARSDRGWRASPQETKWWGGELLRMAGGPGPAGPVQRDGPAARCQPWTAEMHARERVQSRWCGGRVCRAGRTRSSGGNATCAAAQRLVRATSRRCFPFSGICHLLVLLLLRGNLRASSTRLLHSNRHAIQSRRGRNAAPLLHYVSLAVGGLARQRRADLRAAALQSGIYRLFGTCVRPRARPARDRHTIRTHLDCVSHISAANVEPCRSCCGWHCSRRCIVLRSSARLMQQRCSTTSAALTLAVKVRQLSSAHNGS